MVDRRTNRAVRASVTTQPPSVQAIEREGFREMLYAMGDQSHMTDANHSIDYVNNRAPRIRGKVYSGLAMQRHAKSTMNTQPRKRYEMRS